VQLAETPFLFFRAFEVGFPKLQQVWLLPACLPLAWVWVQSPWVTSFLDCLPGCAIDYHMPLLIVTLAAQ
jgi:hypothetical protein